MKSIYKPIASIVAIAALALVAAATVGAANSEATYTCTRVKQNGQLDVRVGVPASAVAGLTNAGFECGTPPSEDEEEDPGNEDPGNEDPGNEDPGNEDPGNEDPGNEDLPVDAGPAPVDVGEPYVPQESRSIYCSTVGPALRANGDGAGISLNLTTTEGAVLTALGLVRPANFYQDIGASCDLLPGFEYAGYWVDNVGDVIEGVAVYPLFVPSTV